MSETESRGPPTHCQWQNTGGSHLRVRGRGPHDNRDSEMGVEQATVFVDTNVFLEFKQFTQLPWRKIAGADRVTLAVCLPVISELDEEKTYNRHRKADRAKKSYKDIEDNENKEFQEGVTVTIVTYSLRRENYPETMNPDHHDDQIIRCAGPSSGSPRSRPGHDRHR